MIEYLPHRSIDKEEWDYLVEHADRPNFYDRSTILDVASPGWDGLIDRASGSVMPLCHRKKFLIRYLFQPLGLQYCGSYNNDIKHDQLERFLGAIPHEFRYWDICTPTGGVPSHVEIEERMNMQLTMDREYEELLKGYSQGHRRNLRGGEELEFRPMQIEEFIDAFRKTTARLHGIGPKDIRTMQEILRVASQEGRLTILSLRGSQCAAAFIEWKRTLIFFKSANDDIGREQNGLFRVVDQVIKANTRKVDVIDFAGSDHLNTQRFYKGFGAVGNVYLRVRYNAIPFPFNLLKQ
jgi:hypothetical protein